MKRRSFIQKASLGLVAVGSQSNSSTFQHGSSDVRNSEGKYRISLKGDAIGIHQDWREMIRLANVVGFQALAVPSEWLVEMSARELTQVKDTMQKSGLTYGSAGMPVQFRESRARFEADLTGLPRHAKAMQATGITRVGTWIMPSHAELTYEENMELHVNRLRECARIYADHGIRLGLEYVGTKRLYAKQPHGFVRTGRQLKAMIKAVDVPSLGVILDSFHWYTSGEDQRQLEIWKNEDVVAVDLNDADAHLAREEQVDQNRELPGATGKIDLKAFVEYLKLVEYDGPVRAEPFNATLSAMDDELAARATFQSLSKVLQ